jgi:hypothetical protein
VFTTTPFLLAHICLTVEQTTTSLFIARLCRTLMPVPNLKSR